MCTYVCFHGRKRVHTRLCSKDHTQRPTGRSRAFRLGVVSHYPRRALRVAETLDARLSKRLICRFPGLVTSSLISAA